MSSLPPDLGRRIESELAHQPSQTRSQVRARRRLWIAVGLTMIVGAALLHGVPQASAERPLRYIVLNAAAALGIAVVATRMVLMGGESNLGLPRSLLLALAVGVPIALVFGALLANVVAPQTWATSTRGWAAHLMCVGVYAQLAAGLLVVCFFGFRPLDPIAPSTTGAAVGAALGAWATFAVSLQCPSPDPAHVVLTHVAPGLALIALGAGIGRRVLTFRYRARRPVQ